MTMIGLINIIWTANFNLIATPLLRAGMLTNTCLINHMVHAYAYF